MNKKYDLEEVLKLNNLKIEQQFGINKELEKVKINDLVYQLDQDF